MKIKFALLLSKIDVFFLITQTTKFIGSAHNSLVQCALPHKALLNVLVH